MTNTESPSAVADAVTTVVGTHGDEYSCTDICAVDAHLSKLCERITRAAHRFPKHVQGFRADIDLLLDRRCWLELLAEPAPCPPGGSGAAT